MRAAGPVEGVVAGTRSPRFLFIDALRGLAAMSVVLFHLSEGRHITSFLDLLPAPARAVFHHGDLGVQIFFVLSGFVIAHSMARESVDGRYVGRFMLRRSIRLDPPYWASMILVVALSLISARAMPGKVYTLPTVGQVVAHLFYAPNLLGMPLINPIYWTLCIEIQFYVSFALLMLLVTRLRRTLPPGTAFSVVMIPAALFADLWAFRVEPLHVPGLFLEQWHLFMVGVLLWNAVVGAATRRNVEIAAVSIGVLVLAAIAHRDLALAVGCGAATLIFLAGRWGKLTTWLGGRAWQVLGALSYSLYLTHNPITGAAFRIGFRLTGRSTATEALWLLPVVGLCVAFAWVFNRLIEGPSLALSHRIRLRVGAAPALAIDLPPPPEQPIVVNEQGVNEQGL
jgi:peptidoglycan/LPS O-acetylase OafA/YrhL